MPAQLEHINVTVRNPMATAAWMQDVFGWHVRWQGESIYGGTTVHVGSDDQYLALYAPNQVSNAPGDTYTRIAGLNHIAMVVDDLDDIEAKVREKGFHVGQHHDYEPGRRFYFDDPDGIEFEMVSYER